MDGNTGYGRAVRLSGFSFVRNAVDLYYPVVESIRSALPICDEFVIAAGDSNDTTTELLRGIGDPKLRIIETTWDREQFVRGASNAVQTNLALAACSGDWALYLQADEVLHEDDVGPLAERLHAYRDDPRIDGLVFEYLHFYADYDHYQTSHNWYRREVRMVRNHRGIRSWKSAQGFRHADGRKLRVVPAGARIFHYGWVRPPLRMTRKARALAEVHLGTARARDHVPDLQAGYDFGRLHGRARFTGTHPAVMRERIAACDWRVLPTPTRQRHDRASVRLLSWLENRVLGFRIAEHRNYILLPG
jgi:glycosyltransferase involved in cell wall biosynthesis